MTEHNYITIVGRSESKENFAKEVLEALDDAFSIGLDSVHSLGDYFEFDKKERFILFATIDEQPDNDSVVEMGTHILRSKNFGVNLFHDLEEALTHSKENYNFESEPDVEEKAKRIAEVREKFPYFSAEEWEQFQVFDAMYHTGKIVPIRGRHNDEIVMVLSSVAHGHDEVRVTPMAIIINKHIEDELVLPFEEDD